MKQNIFPYYNSYSAKVAVSAALDAILAKAIRVLDTWKQRITQRTALAKLDSHLLADVGIPQRQRLAEIDKGPVQEETKNRIDDAYNTQEAGNAGLVTGNRDSLSESFNAEIDAWAKHALASNGFGDYLR